ncbi:MAG: tol-pal system protein YbgF [Cellvibrionaceae bacterium]
MRLIKFQSGPILALTLGAFMAPSLFAPQVIAQSSSGIVPVTESQPLNPAPLGSGNKGSGNKGSANQSPVNTVSPVGSVREIQEVGEPPTGNTNAQLFYRLQLLEQQVQQLRGILEEQEHELALLKKQRMDDYLDLDRRVSQLSKGVSVPVSSQPTTPSANLGMLNGDERSSYKAAFSLLSKRQFDQARDDMKLHLEKYPEGSYAANAHYWLGEIFLLQQKYEDSRQWFIQLLEKFPQHRKVPDAKFKLGKVYHMMGDAAKAKQLLKEVSVSNSDAASLAKQYLEANLR